MASRIKSIAVLSVHTCPVAALGGKKTGGMNVYVRELARELGKHGIQVDIFTRCESEEAAEIRRLGPNVKVIHVASGPGKTLAPIEIYPHLEEFTRNVEGYQQKQGSTYDLLHSHYWLSGLVALKLQRHWGIPVLQNFHTLGKVKNLFLKKPEPPVRLIAERRIIDRVDRIIAATQDELAHLENLYDADVSKISIIPPGVDTNRFQPKPQSLAKAKIGVSQKKQLILFVGRLEPIKGLETLLKAIAILKKRSPKDANGDITYPNLSLAIIGGEDQDRYFKAIKQKAGKLGIGETTSFLGSQDQRVLPNYYSAAEVTIIPSSHESFGIVALESMACATPVIVSNVGGLQYLVEHKKTGILVPPDKSEPLAVAIKMLLEDHERKKSLGKNAHQKAQHYAWPKITSKITKLYRETTR
ncbi:glycosyltransferase [Patescibacteria group bacterium]|nr:glycosyltransferase [Patescibacteria group bacterium]